MLKLLIDQIIKKILILGCFVEGRYEREKKKLIHNLNIWDSFFLEKEERDLKLRRENIVRECMQTYCYVYFGIVIEREEHEQERVYSCPTFPQVKEKC